jgi:hypothetical protein
LIGRGRNGTTAISHAPGPILAERGTDSGTRPTVPEWLDACPVKLAEDARREIEKLVAKPSTER